AGLIGDYYYTRWKMYVDQALVDVDEGNKYDAAGYNESVHAFEWEWSTWTDPIPLPEANDVLGFSRSLQAKYADGINVLKTMK
ncbi:MAG: alpha-N-acetylglucosaminidase C-terminal domain-containing protein, partial [Bacteroidales bacterium]|nr:alpha-N-acetylglucosaminidase C-terminal domain-containing protein [Candidatus Sodaliphilus aphodohippi]